MFRFLDGALIECFGGKMLEYVLYFKRYAKNRNIRAACLEFGDEDVAKGDG